MLTEGRLLEYWNVCTVFHRGGYRERQAVAPQLHRLAETDERLRDVIVRDIKIEIGKLGVTAP